MYEMCGVFFPSSLSFPIKDTTICSTRFLYKHEKYNFDINLFVYD